MALISDLPNATPQKSDLMEIQNGQTSSNNSSVGQLMQLSASENLAPAYNTNAGVYAVGDFACYNGTLYQCNTAIATPEAFDATKWTAVKVTEISSGASVVQLTQAEYTALTTAEKMNGSIYKITDNAKMYCLDKAYHPVEECTVAEYNQKTSAQQNNGTIYIQTDAETTGEDIPVNTVTPNTSVNQAINACWGRTGSDIPVSTGATETIADMFVNNGILLTKESNIDTFEYACRKVGKVVSLSVVFTFSSTPTYNQTIASNLPAPMQQLQIFVCCVAGTNSGKVSRARISNTGLLTDWYSSTDFFKTGDTYLISAMYLSAD